ncbi:MAG: 2-isopropylmalate synthase [bacterium]
MSKKRIIKIFDTTLRDGEQCPGATLNQEEKLEIAKQLTRLNVDIIEAGFAIASPGDFESIKQIAKEVHGPVICSLARARKEDIDAAWGAVQYAKKHRIHTFIATSPIHMKYKFKKSPDEILEIAVNMVKYAKKYCEDVEFSAEDAGRSDPKFLYKIVREVIRAGATTVNIPDTVGYTIPEKFGELISDIIKNVPEIKKCDLAVHCHNDLGMATANSLAAVMNGATQVECTINGIGERAGNASLEEIVMAIHTRRDLFNCETNINTIQIYKTSRMVSNLTGLLVQPNKAVVGANAFAHEAGIHQDGVLKERTTYEIMNAADIGLTEGILVLGKHSGRHAFNKRMKDLGYELSPDESEKAFKRFKELCDKKKEISDRDLESIVSDEIYTVPEIYKLEFAEVTSGTHKKPAAKVHINYGGELIKVEETGDGPVDAIYRAIDKAVKTKVKLLDYIIQAITGGTDAIGEVMVRIQEGDNIYTGRGGDTDIIIASAKAYLNAINKMKHDSTNIPRKGM